MKFMVANLQHQSKEDSTNIYLDKERSETLGWLSKLDFEETHQRNFSIRYGKTGEWFLKTKEFTEWIATNHSSLLWCYGARKFAIIVPF